jgi:GntR family transcriptional regulator / MocR family aminotransferase
MVLPKGPIPLVSTGPLLGLDLDRDRPLGLQIERQVRELVRSGALEVGHALPSTRTLAADLRVSRGVVVGAYTQLAAEGYIAVRRGAPPTVAAVASTPVEVETDPNLPFARATCLPDFALFPRAQWLTVVRSSLQDAAGQDFAYGEPQGASELRRRLPAFLARTRGVVGTSDRTCIFAGSSQALFVLASVLRARGATRIAVEDPSHRWRTTTLAASGVELVPVHVDEEGLRVDELPDVSAVVVSPEHQFPTGAALSPERRRALLDWAAVGDRVVIEHDYDGHFRYDRAPAAALQGLAPERVAYVGSASALLAPTVRVGWAVLPGALVAPVVEYLFATSIAAPRLTQLALAEYLERGFLDRHLRKVGAAYRRRREALVASLAKHVPEARVVGSAAGLFLSLSFPADTDEPALLEAAREQGIGLDGFNEHATTPQTPGVALGFACESEPVLRYGARLLGLSGEDRRRRTGVSPSSPFDPVGSVTAWPRYAPTMRRAPTSPRP